MLIDLTVSVIELGERVQLMMIVNGRLALISLTCFGIAILVSLVVMVLVGTLTRCRVV